MHSVLLVCFVAAARLLKTDLDKERISGAAAFLLPEALSPEWVSRAVDGHCAAQCFPLGFATFTGMRPGTAISRCDVAKPVLWLFNELVSAGKGFLYLMLPVRIVR